MAGQDTRVGERQPTSMRIKLKYPDVETFIQKYAVNISRGGIFIATKQPKPVGTLLRFEFLLANSETGTSIIRGEGQVQWTREFDPTQPAKAHGMGVKFTRLDPDSQAVVDRALAFRATQARREEGAPTSAEPVVDSRPVALPPEPAPVPPPVPRPPPLLAPLTNDPETTRADFRSDITTPDATRPDITRPDFVRPDFTRPLPVEALPDARAGRAPDETTRPIPVPDDAPVRATTTRVKLSIERDPSRELRIDAALKGAAGADLDALAAEWGIAPERIERVLRRKRPRMVEATAELERLLRKPPRGAPPTKAEALAGLRALLERGSPVLELDAVAADEAEGEQPLKRAR